MKILLALDATPPCRFIVEEAAARPWPSDSTFFLLHVLDPFPFVKAPISLKRAQETTRAELEKLAETLTAAGWKAEFDVVLGHPRRDITKTAASWKADLVMTGSNDLSVLTRLFVGSTARAVLRDSSCSVEIVRPLASEQEVPDRRISKIVVATDGSDCSVAALCFVATRPWPKGTQAKVIALPEPFFPLGAFPYVESREIEKLNAAALKEAQKNAAAGAEILSRIGIQVSTEAAFPEDSTARVILNEAEKWGAQLIVLGSHGRRGLDRLTMGSVSEYVAFHSACSVEVIREAKSRAGNRKKGEGR
jgi:nucleotide-binding universal stress UspA family protein